VPPSTWLSPAIIATSSTLSTPFCKVSTTVFEPIIGFNIGNAVELSYALTATTTTSTGPTLEVSLSAAALATKFPSLAL
jgi:hypothetical protein